ncbi:hypothetical protein BDA99DRAFT_496556 [Phascolomyces articulosus]|uniref:Uncharacterized protein n=1 Tax=Phascolomyces articulosus TaxID=60185 RepID=A0AAD5PIB2_9FUNG|nr:hypothetical protein BDA99DRAFT_496556 [Phascolomyces articulosus]
MQTSRAMVNMVSQGGHITHYQLKCKNAAGEQPTPTEIMHGIHNEIYNRNYKAAEELFQDLIKSLENKKMTYEQRQRQQQQEYQQYQQQSLPFRFREQDIISFQRSIAKLVRLAPTPSKALHFTHILLYKIDPPLRDPKIENTVLIHLIKVYSKYGGEWLVKGLDFVKIGVERGLAQTPKISKPMYHLPDDAFEVTSIPILRHHQLKFSRNGLSLESWGPRTL